MGRVVVINASGQQPPFRLFQCPKCANIVQKWKGNVACKAFSTTYAMGDVGPSNFSDNMLESGCDSFEPAPPDYRFFDGETEEEAVKLAVEACGREVAERVEIVRSNSGAKDKNSGVRVTAVADTLGEAIAQVKAKIPVGATNIRMTQGLVDNLHPESGESEVRRAEEPRDANVLPSSCGVPWSARIESVSQIEQRQSGEFMAEVVTEQEIRRNWSQLIKRNELPADAEFDRAEIEVGEHGTFSTDRFSITEIREDWALIARERDLPATARCDDIVLGQIGFLGFFRKPSIVTWRVAPKTMRVFWHVDPKWKIRWRQAFVEFRFFSPTIVRVRP